MKRSQRRQARRTELTPQARLSREQGTIFKDWGGRLPIALVYPNTYHVGMSSLGMQTLYRLLNARQDVVCERVFWERELRRPLPTSPTARWPTLRRSRCPSRTRWTIHTSSIC